MGKQELVDEVADQQALELGGDLIFDTVLANRKIIVNALRKDSSSSFVIDLKGINQCDSAGLAMMIDLKRLARRQNNQINFVNLPKQMKALADFCGVSSILQ